MISQSAQNIRDGLVRDVLDETPIELKRKQWEVFAREQPTPSGVNVQHLELAGVPCLLCTGEQPSSNTMIVYCHGGGLKDRLKLTVPGHVVWLCILVARSCRFSIDWHLNTRILQVLKMFYRCAMRWLLINPLLVVFVSGQIQRAVF